MLILDIDDQNTMYVVPPKGIQVASLKLNIQLHQIIQLIHIGLHVQKMILILDSTINLIVWMCVCVCLRKGDLYDYFNEHESLHFDDKDIYTSPKNYLKKATTLKGILV